MIPCFKCRHESIKSIRYRYLKGGIFKWIRVNICRECLSEFKSPFKFKSFSEMVQQARQRIELRYSLVTREEWNNLREVKRQLEHHDKTRCRVCDAEINQDKCWKCGYYQSKERTVIHYLTKDRNCST